jgi:hypothetical protein
MKYISWNINGIRATLKTQYFKQLIDTYNPDFICLQEVKATLEQVKLRHNMARQFRKAWEVFSVAWAKSKGGQYSAPGTAKVAKQPAGAATGAAPAAGTAAPTAAGQNLAKQQALYATIQSLDNKQLNAVAKILSQRVGPEATMNALKAPAPVTESTLNEFGWNDFKAGAQQVGAGLKSAYKTVKPYAKKALKTGANVIKAAPGAIATGAGATAGAIAGMPGRATTAYRSAKDSVSGPKMTMQELQLALTKLTTQQAQKLFAFVQQLQTARKAGLNEGIMPANLLPGYEQALKAFVQKNLLSGTQYSRLQNAQDIDEIISDIVDPANDTPAAQESLWDKLVLATSVAQHEPGQYSPSAPAAAGAAPAKSSTAQAQAPATSAKAGTLNQIMDGIGITVNPRQLKMLGQAMQQDSGINEIHSNGDPVLDQLLTQLGYRVI